MSTDAPPGIAEQASGIVNGDFRDHYPSFICFTQRLKALAAVT